MFDLQTARREARSLDRLMIRRRIHIVRRNLIEIENVNRSAKYIQRLAGGAPEDMRRSREKRHRVNGRNMSRTRYETLYFNIRPNGPDSNDCPNVGRSEEVC